MNVYGKQEIRPLTILSSKLLPAHWLEDQDDSSVFCEQQYLFFICFAIKLLVLCINTASRDHFCIAHIHINIHLFKVCYVNKYLCVCTVDGESKFWGPQSSALLNRHFVRVQTDCDPAECIYVVSGDGTWWQMG